MTAPSDQELREQLISYTCQRNCCGVAQQSGVCCTLGDNDWILGPVEDYADVLIRLEKKFGRPFSFNEVFIAFEEGSVLFPDKSSWQNPAHYPALRVVPDAKRSFACQFLKAGSCSIHEIKPNVCRGFVCEYVQKILRSTLGS